MPRAVLAFVLISADLGHEQDLLKELKRINGVREAYGVYGTYDLIAELEVESQEEVKNVVFSRIRNLDNVKSTLTMIVGEGSPAPEQKMNAHS